MRNYDTYRTEPPECKEAPDLPGLSGHRQTHHKPCRTEVRYVRKGGEWVLICEKCGPVSESHLYDPQDEGCPECGCHVPDELYDDEQGCCVACADKKVEVCY